MSKRKEIKFRRSGRGTCEGRQDGVIYRIYEDWTLVGTGKPTCTVSTCDTKGKGRDMHLGSYRRFSMDEAKEFCQKIAAGEVDLEALRAEIEAAEAEKGQAALREIVEKAKKFRDRLDTMGLKYTDLLELEELANDLGDIGHHVLLGYERGEGWPSGT
uniref:Uncharacterized protein n=1 Tax=Dulem virus 34 TaxID=3145752 RepID=A0AAU8B796_9CAUD